MHSNCLSAKGRVHWDRSKHTSAKFKFCLRVFLTCATCKYVRQNLIPLATAYQWQCSRHKTPLSILSMCTFVNSVLCKLCQTGQSLDFVQVQIRCNWSHINPTLCLICYRFWTYFWATLDVMVKQQCYVCCHLAHYATHALFQPACQ